MNQLFEIGQGDLSTVKFELLRQEADTAQLTNPDLGRALHLFIDCLQDNTYEALESKISETVEKTEEELKECIRDTLPEDEIADQFGNIADSIQTLFYSLLEFVDTNNSKSAIKKEIERVQEKLEEDIDRFRKLAREALDEFKNNEL